MLNPFDSPRALLQRAHEHIQEMEARFNTFLNRQPYTRLIEPDLGTREEIHQIWLTEPLPLIVSVVAYDAINALRSTLDHAVAASASALGHEDLSAIKFPFGDTADAAKADAKGRRHCHPAEPMRNYLLSLEPYEGGANEAIWALNKLRNIKNHQRLIRFGVNISNLRIDRGIFVGGPTTLVRTWNDARDKFTILRTGAHPLARHYQLEVAVYPELSEPAALAGKPATATLHELGGMISGIIDGIEAETTRIKAAETA